MEISFIVPMYNSFKTIERCVKSILEQLDEEDELIIIDDGSSDDSLKKVQSILSDNPLVKIYSQVNRGVGETRNSGIKYASKKWITFVDSDDYLDMDLKRIARNTLDDGVDVILYEHYFEDTENNYLANGKETQYTGNDIREFIKKCFLNESPKGQFDLRSIWANIYRRDFIIENNIMFHNDIVIGEDMLFMLEIFKSAINIKFVNLPIYHYFFVNTDSLTNKYKPEMYNDIKKFDQHVRLILDKDEIMSYYYYRMNDIILLMKYTYFNKQNNCRYLCKRKEFIKTIKDGNYKGYYKILCENNLQKKYSISKRITFYFAINEFMEVLYMIFKIKYWRQ